MMLEIAVIILSLVVTVLSVTGARELLRWLPAVRSLPYWATSMFRGVYLACVGASIGTCAFAVFTATWHVLELAGITPRIPQLTLVALVYHILYIVLSVIIARTLLSYARQVE